MLMTTIEEYHEDMTWLISDIPQKLANGEITIPSVQRGLVWNAVRAEILWDSLMRGIPIGVLTVKLNSSGNYELFDGQQRVNAITMGYAEIPTNNSSLEEKQKPILWIDLCPPSIKTERKFFFMVTTESQPWGYNITQDETNNSRLNSIQKKHAIDEIKDNWENHDHNGAKPYPHELFPVKAQLPVPFSLVRKFIDDNHESTFDTFLAYCREKVSDYNWKAKLPQSSCEILEQAWDKIKASVCKLNKMSIIAHNIAIDNDDIGIYFQRMNKSGDVPNNEEIRYSRLKAMVPDLKGLDEIAKNKMKPSRLAHIAMISFLSAQKKECVSDISNACIRDLCSEQILPHFLQFIKEELRNHIYSLEKILLLKNGNELGIPDVIYSSIHMNPVLYSLLLFWVKKSETLDPKLITAFSTVVLWFGTSAATAVHAFNYFLDKCNMNEQIIRECFFKLIKSGLLAIPPSLSAIDGCGDKSNLKDLNSALQIPYNIDRIWKWDVEQGRGILLYATRKYIKKTFGDYSPQSGCWDEENRPWDYDHIFPRAWLKGTHKGDCNELNDKLLNSIGNIAPIPFSRNRGKNDSPPGKYLDSDDNSLLFVSPNDFFYGKQQDFDNNHDVSKSLSDFVISRFKSIYDQWYTTLAIERLFYFDEINDCRRKLFNDIKSELKKEYNDVGIFFAIGAQQHGCQCSADWARPWLAVGIDTGRDFVAVASDGNEIEIGLRRRPQNSNIDGKNFWYRDDKCNTSHKFGDDKLAEKLVNELKDLIKESEQAKTKNPPLNG